MNTKIDELLKQNMSVDEFQTPSQLNENTLKKVAARKKLKQGAPTIMHMIVDLLLHRFRALSIGFVMIAIIFGINYLCTFNFEKETSKVTNTTNDTALTVTSNTFLATLKQSTIIEVPARTSTALTCISTFVARN